MTNCRITPSILRCSLASPSREKLIFIFFSRDWMQSLKRCFFPVSPCTKYITHSCGVISAPPFLLRRHNFPWHRFLKFPRYTLLREIGRYRKKGAFPELWIRRRRNFGHAWIKSRFSFCPLDRCLLRQTSLSSRPRCMRKMLLHCDTCFPLDSSLQTYRCVKIWLSTDFKGQ